MHSTTVMVGHLHQSRASGVQLSNKMPTHALNIRWIVSFIPWLLVPPWSILTSPLPGVGEGHLCGAQLAVLISRCQEFENDLAHQLVGTRRTRESLYRCLPGPSPGNKTQWGLGEGGREGSFHTHTHTHTPEGSHQTKGNPHHFTQERKNFHWSFFHWKI